MYDVLVENGMDVSRTRALGKYMYHDEQLAFQIETFAVRFLSNSGLVDVYYILSMHNLTILYLHASGLVT